LSRLTVGPFNSTFEGWMCTGGVEPKTAGGRRSAAHRCLCGPAATVNRNPAEAKSTRDRSSPGVSGTGRSLLKVGQIVGSDRDLCPGPWCRQSEAVAALLGRVVTRTGNQSFHPTPGCAVMYVWTGTRRACRWPVADEDDEWFEGEESQIEHGAVEGGKRGVLAAVLGKPWIMHTRRVIARGLAVHDVGHDARGLPRASTADPLMVNVRRLRWGLPGKQARKGPWLHRNQQKAIRNPPETSPGALSHPAQAVSRLSGNVQRSSISRWRRRPVYLKVEEATCIGTSSSKTGGHVGRADPGEETSAAAGAVSRRRAARSSNCPWLFYTSGVQHLGANRRNRSDVGGDWWPTLS